MLYILCSLIFLVLPALSNSLFVPPIQLVLHFTYSSSLVKSPLNFKYNSFLWILFFGSFDI